MTTKYIKVPLLLATAVLLLTGCRSETEQKKAELQQQCNELVQQRDSVKKEIAELNAIKEATGVNRYYITIEVKQSHLTFDISEHMKDQMNAVELEIPVDKGFYNSVSSGTVLDDSFRSGSFFAKGSLGSWDIKVIDKDVR